MRDPFEANVTHVARLDAFNTGINYLKQRRWELAKRDTAAHAAYTEMIAAIEPLLADTVDNPPVSVQVTNLAGKLLMDALYPPKQD